MNRLQESLRYFQFLMRDVRIAPTSNYFFTSPPSSPPSSPPLTPIFGPTIEMKVLRHKSQCSSASTPAHSSNPLDVEKKVELPNPTPLLPTPIVKKPCISEMERRKGSISFLLHEEKEVEKVNPMQSASSSCVEMTPITSSPSFIQQETRFPLMESQVQHYVEPMVAVPKIKSIKLFYHPPQDSAIQLEPIPTIQPKKVKETKPKQKQAQKQRQKQTPVPKQKQKLSGEVKTNPTLPKKQQKRKANHMELNPTIALTPAKKCKQSNPVSKASVKGEKLVSRKRKQKEMCLEEPRLIENSIPCTQTKKRKRV